MIIVIYWILFNLAFLLYGLITARGFLLHKLVYLGVININIVCLMVGFSVLYNESSFADIAMIYVLFSYVVNFALTRKYTSNNDDM